MAHRLAATCLVFACLATAEATEVFVATTGNDANPGTVLQPFATVARAVEAATRPGDIVTIRGGTYTLADTVNLDASGVGGSPLTVRGAAGEQVVLRAPDMGTGVIQVQGSWWVISRLTARDGQVGIRLEVSLDAAGNVAANCSHIAVEDCTVTDNHGWAGIQIDAGGGAAHAVPNGRDIAVRRCVLTNNGETDHHHGVYVDGGDDGLIEDCIVSGNSGFGLHFYGDRQEGYPDILVGGRRAVVRRNRCYGNGYRGNGGCGIVFAMGESPGLGIDEEWRDAVIEGNLCYDKFEYGILVDYGRADGVFTSNAVVRNNTCFRNRVGQVRVDANFYAGPDGRAFGLPGGAFADFARWRADGTRDARGALGDAAFVSETAPDLHLRPESQAIGRGVLEEGLFAAVDFDGQPLPACGDFDGDGRAETVVGLGAYPTNGGWLVALDAAAGGFRALRWGRVGLDAYDRANGEPWPAVAR